MGFRIQPMMRLRHCRYGVGHLHTLVKVDVPVTPFTASYQDFPDQTANNQRICGSSPSCGSGVCTASVSIIHILVWWGQNATAPVTPFQSALVICPALNVTAPLRWLMYFAFFS